MKNKLILVLSFLVSALTSCSDDNDFVKCMWVNSEKVESLSWGGESIRCLDVQVNEFINENDWRALCQGIKGFSNQYEEGYVYKISVNKIKIKNPLQDASSVEYELIEILSKELKE